MPVGSFSSESRTLYVGGLPGGRFATKLKERLAEHFGEWGELENINYIPRINAAFVRYRLRANAEFARVRRTCVGHGVCVCVPADAGAWWRGCNQVAMENQNLGGNEILNVRWAHDDPNPVAKRAVRLVSLCV